MAYTGVLASQIHSLKKKDDNEEQEGQIKMTSK